MNGKPFLSICVPAYNKSDRLKTNLTSLLNACGDNIEVVVMDNVSAENLEEICKSFNDPRISYYRNEKPIPASANWIRSVRFAKGQWALLMMDKDFINGNGIPALMEELKKNKDFGTGRVIRRNNGSEEIYSEKPQIVKVEKFQAGEIPTLLQLNGDTHPSGDLYNRDFLTLSEACEDAIAQNPRLKDNIYPMLEPAWNHGFLKIQEDMIYTPTEEYAKLHESGFKASLPKGSEKSSEFYTPDGVKKFIREDLEEMLKLKLSSEEKKELCVQVYNGYAKAALIGVFLLPRNSYVWTHYGEKYKRHTAKERERIASEFCESYKENVRMLLEEDAEDVLAAIEPIRVDWSIYAELMIGNAKHTIAHIPVIGPFLLQVKRRLRKMVRGI